MDIEHHAEGIRISRGEDVPSGIAGRQLSGRIAQSRSLLPISDRSLPAFVSWYARHPAPRDIALHNLKSWQHIANHFQRRISHHTARWYLRHVHWIRINGFACYTAVSMSILLFSPIAKPDI